MQISFVCEGGFANLRLSYDCDTDTLPEREATELVDAVKASGILREPPPRPAPEGLSVPDAMSYRVTVSDHGESVTWEVTDVTAPADLRPLIQLLQDAALARRAGR